MFVTYFSKVKVAELNGHLTGKELFIRFTAHAFRKLLSIYVFSYFPFGFEGRIWDLIVSVPDHCLSFYFTLQQPRPRFCCGSYKHRHFFGPREGPLLINESKQRTYKSRFIHINQDS